MELRTISYPDLGIGLGTFVTGSLARDKVQFVVICCQDLGMGSRTTLRGDAHHYYALSSNYHTYEPVKNFHFM